MHSFNCDFFFRGQVKQNMLLQSFSVVAVFSQIFVLFSFLAFLSYNPNFRQSCAEETVHCCIEQF